MQKIKDTGRRLGLGFASLRSNNLLFLFAIFYSLAGYSLFAIFYSLFAIFRSLFAYLGPLFAIFCSLSAIRYFLFAISIGYWLPAIVY